MVISTLAGALVDMANEKYLVGGNQRGFTSKGNRMSNRLFFRSLAVLGTVLTLTLVPFATTQAQIQLGEGKPQVGLPKLTLTVGGQTVVADVAATDVTREKGLMHRTKMAKSEGMLFVFPQIGYHAMWMRNTPINLSVAYIDEKGKIISIHEMEAFNETAHQALGPARFALEMNASWFSQHNVKAGDTIGGLERAPKPK
jgi:uncharacterized membrane protein (UPF0127 family)